MTAVKLAPGDTRSEDRGHLTIRTACHHDGIAFTVLVGATRSDLLSHGFPNARLAAARVWYRALVEAADEGLKVTAIEDRMAALLAAGNALTEGATA